MSLLLRSLRCLRYAAFRRCGRQQPAQPGQQRIQAVRLLRQQSLLAESVPDARVGGRFQPG
ncbi:hypothetical protein D3C80_1827630 [compost metagenome]